MQCPGERGSTLLLITWIFLVAGVIAAFTFYRAESEWGLVVGLEKSISFRQIAEAALRERLAALISDGTEFDSMEDEWYGNGRIEAEENGYRITTLIEDEGSKLNLNLMKAPAFQYFLGDDLPADPLIDWRDEDDEPRSSGAEKEYYQELNPGYKPRNGFLATVEELQQIKDGEKIYPLLAPELTVYGKVNPNIVDDEFLKGLLLAHGFEKNWVEQVIVEFINYANKTGFKEYDDFLRNLKSVTIPVRDKFKTIFHFTGNMNINFVTKDQLKAFLKNFHAEDNSDFVEGLLKRRPFETNDEVVRRFDTQFKNKVQYAKINNGRSVNYFTTVSTIIRYRIWVEKGTRKFYLETVQERLPGRIKGQWKVYPLSWRTMNNREVPGIPKKPEEEET
jgi:type II secretory pathway component PulK